MGLEGITNRIARAGNVVRFAPLQVALAAGVLVAAVAVPDYLGLAILASLAPTFNYALAPFAAIFAVPYLLDALGYAPALQYVIGGALGGVALVLAAKQLDIPLDLPQAMKAARWVGAWLASRGNNTGMPMMPVKIKLRKEPSASDGEWDSEGLSFPMPGPMEMEETLITFDFISLLLAIASGAVATIDTLAAIAVFLFAVVGLEFQERRPLSTLPAALAVLIARFFPYAAPITTLVAPQAREPEPEPEPEETAPPDPSQMWLEEVLSRVRAAAQQHVLPETPVQVQYLGREGIQEMIGIDIAGQPAPPAFLKKVASGFGDLEFAVGRRTPPDGNSRVLLLIVNPHVRLPEVTREVYLEEARNTPPGQLLVGFTSLGVPIRIDLSTQPHAGVWGGSGTGKSVTMRTAIIGGTLGNSPEQVGLFIFDPKAVTFAGVDFASVYGMYILPFPITCATIVALEEARRRMRAMSAMGVEKFAEYNAKVGENDALALCIMAFEELEFLQQQTESSTTGGAKKPGVLSPLLFDDSSPYPPEEREELANFLPRTFFAQPTLWQVFVNALRQLLAVARACGMHAVLCTQTPQAAIVPATARGNIAVHVFHRLPESVGGVVRNVLGGDRTVMPWHLPSGVKGMFVLYPDEATGRGVYIPIEEIQTLTAGYTRSRLPLLITRDPAIISPPAVERYKRIDRFMLDRQIAEGTITEEQANKLMERWYTPSGELRALTEGVPLPPGMMIDLALRVPMSV